MQLKLSESIYMPYSIHIDDAGITTVVYSGSVGLGERKNAVNEVCGMVEPSMPVRLLIDVRNIVMSMSTDEQVTFGKYVASRGQFSKAKVAVVHKAGNNPNIMITTTDYLEFYHVVDFDDLNEARSCLSDAFQ